MSREQALPADRWSPDWPAASDSHWMVAGRCHCFAEAVCRTSHSVGGHCFSQAVAL